MFFNVGARDTFPIRSKIHFLIGHVRHSLAG
jgi:hypothetical protein